MHAASGTPEEEVIFDVLLFSLLAIITSIAVSIGLVIYNKRRSEE
jgi:hypothetical protein